MTDLRVLRGKPVEGVVELLEDLMEQAREGKLQAVCCLSSTNDGRVGHHLAGTWDLSKLVYTIEALKLDRVLLALTRSSDE